MMTTAEQLCERLSARGWHITFAESCTGGLAAATLVGVSGASSVFDGSFVTYANHVKEELLGVKPASIAACGVVSETVAGEMAEGAARAMGCEVAVGISGIAGPLGGTPNKPVGTVCFGFSVAGRVVTETMHFSGDRTAVREAAVAHALARTCEIIIEE